MNLAYLQNLTALLKSTGPTPYFFISGGALKDSYEGKKPNDFDIFSADPESLLKVLKYVFGKERDTETHWFFQWDKSSVSLQKKPESDPQKIWEDFDYVDCMASYDSERKVYKHENWDNVLSNKLIKYTGITPHPEIALIRCMLRLKEGWTITSEECKKFVKEEQALWQSTKFETRDMMERKKLYHEIINSSS